MVCWLFGFCCVCGLPCLPLFDSWVFPVKILHPIRVSFHFVFPVVDRLCHVLARQCREKKNLADTQTRSSKNRVTWILKFTLPALAVAGATRRFSAVPRGYGPSGAQALEWAVRYAYPFKYQHEATTLLPNSAFLSLPDHVRTSAIAC